MDTPRSLVTGATGYVGGRLVPELLAAGHTVRVLVRDEKKARAHTWGDDVEISVGDATDADDVGRALADVDVAYYLLHSIGTGDDFAETERGIAQTFADEAEKAGVGRIVYLGGMDPDDEELSEHLRSRKEVGDVLLASSVPTTVLQAGVVIGSGSASFEMLRYLTERLPVMVTPQWVHTRIQPIAVRDVLHYLVGSASMPPEVDRRFDVGGPDVLTYFEMMQRYAAVAGLPKRRVLPVPILSPGLSSHWVGLITPVPASLARPLVESLRNTVVAADRDIAELVPDPDGGLIGFDRSVELALTQVQGRQLPTSYEVPLDAPSVGQPTDPDWAGGSLYSAGATSTVHVPAATTWDVVSHVGGDTGWYGSDLAWRVRAALDRLVGGPGLRRGRTDPVKPGDALDFWRVEEVEDGHLLRLRAETRLPGVAWLELEVTDDGAEVSTLRQTTTFHPRGLLGHLYWWVSRPLHGVVTGVLQRGMVRAAEESAAR